MFEIDEKNGFNENDDDDDGEDDGEEEEEAEEGVVEDCETGVVVVTAHACRSSDNNVASSISVMTVWFDVSFFSTNISNTRNAASLAHSRPLRKPNRERQLDRQKFEQTCLTRGKMALQMQHHQQECMNSHQPTHSFFFRS